MSKIRALVAAAGKGSRANLPYPKTLFQIKNKPLLIKIIEFLEPYDPCPTIIVSPAGRTPIMDCLVDYGKASNLVVQPSPNGMGDAVLHFERSPAFDTTDHVLLVWGDVPFIRPETLTVLIETHLDNDNDFTFVTRNVASAYTRVVRNQLGQITGVEETHELGISAPKPGERDIGLFVFRKALVLEMLKEQLPNNRGKHTKEHGFLYIVEHLAARGSRIEALPIADELEVISFNRFEDLQGLS